MLWRIIFGSSGKAPTNFSAGPWHPEKTHIQKWADWLQARGQPAQVQSSAQAGSRVNSGPADATSH